MGPTWPVQAHARVRAVCRLLLILLLSVVPATVVKAQGVYRVLFADLAIVQARLESPIRQQRDGQSGADYVEFSLEIVVDNLGDLPARDAAAELRIFLFSPGDDRGSGQEMSAATWRQYGVVFLKDGKPPRLPYLNSLQRGVFVAQGLRFNGVPGAYSVTVCIVFPDGLPIGENDRNNCSAPMPLVITDHPHRRSS